MRLFVAIALPGGLARSLAGLQARIPAGRAVPEEDLHLTLAFLGEVADREAEALHDALSGLRGAPVEVALDGLVALGGRVPTVLAAGVTATAALEALRRRVLGAAHAAGLRPERGRFRPHVTLMRFGGRGPSPDEEARLAAFLAANGAVRPGAFVARSFGLYRSDAGRAGRIYRRLADYPLG
ncbi:MAG: RNA 2',3'-cyclic phosphodiesterase [Rhodobacteraceae bacterium]|nr:RNA 2',3'-cyclic phosphodiesterase [Paracoccaceae bacterium]